MKQKHIMAKACGQRMKLVRENYLASTKQVAEKMGVSRSQYSNLERGDRIPNISHLCRFSQIFEGISIDWLLGANCYPYTQRLDKETGS